MGMFPALGRYVTGLKYGTAPLTAGTAPEQLRWCRSLSADARPLGGDTQIVCPCLTVVCPRLTSGTVSLANVMVVDVSCICRKPFISVEKKLILASYVERHYSMSMSVENLFLWSKTTTGSQKLSNRYVLH